MSILNEILYLICFAFICVVFYNLRKRYYLNHLCDHMPEVVSKLGYSIALLGKKGSGKTTSAAGICQYLTTYLICEMLSRMDDIRVKLKTVDFNFINVCVEAFARQNTIDSGVYDDINKFVVLFENRDNKIFDKMRKYNEFESYYTDFISIDEKKSLLKKYMSYYYIVNFRQRYVLSRGYFYNIVSNELGKLFDPSSLELRNVLKNNNWQVDFANVIFDDETSIRDGSALSNDKESKLSGSKDFDALIRNAGEGLVYKISIKQNSEDHIKANRRQIDGNLEIYDMKVYSSFKLTRKLLDFFVVASYFPIKFWYFIRSIFSKKFDSSIAFETYKNKNNKHRKFEYHIFQVKKLLERTGFIRFRYRNYFSSEDVGKKDPSLYNHTILWFPVYYCWGTVKTHEFSYLIDYFKLLSEKQITNETSAFDDKAKTDLFIKDTLKRGE